MLSNFGDFGAKTSLFRYLINQKRNNFIKYCSPPPCINKPPVSEMCIYVGHNLYKWGLDTRGGTMFYRQKMGEGQLTTREIRYSQREITSIVNFLIKAWNFAKLLFMALLTISAMVSSWISPKFDFFGGKIVKILCKNREKLENICSNHICLYIGIKFCTVVVHILNKDIIYNTKLKKSKN